jgi:6-phospho-beta-glucosidase
MRIVIIGGSAFSTPNLLRFLHEKSFAANGEVVLVGRSRDKLEGVARACRLVAGRFAIRTEPMDEWARILSGADTVLIQIRVGGFEGRLSDETVPNKYGLCGDEGLGLGGLSAGWRTWPVLAPILEEIATFCPRAFVVLLTSPLSILVRAALRQMHLKLVGICELPWTTLKDLSSSLGLAANDVQADYLGSNHLGWFFHIRSGSQDLLDRLAEGKRSFPSDDLLRTHRCFPTRYLRMHYEPVTVLAEQISENPRRAEILSLLQQQSHRAFVEEGPNEIARTLKQRATPWYTHAVGPLLLALSGEPVDIPFFLSVPNRSYVSFLSAEAIIECRHSCSDGELVSSPLAGEVPQHIRETLSEFVEFEHVAAEAIVSRSARLLRDALSLHPWTRNHAELQHIVDGIVAMNIDQRTGVTKI